MPDVRDVAEAALGSAPAGTAFARVVAFRGFGSRRASEAALVGADGAVSGSLLGGLADDRLSGAARGLFEIAVGDTDAVAAGLACGGVATLLVSPVGSVPDAAWKAVVDGRPVAVVSLPTGEVPADAAGRAPGDADSTDHGIATRSLALTEDPSTRLLARHGTLGDDALDEAGEAAARTALRGGRETAELHTVGDRTLVVEVYVPTTRLVVVGEATVADALAAQGALLGWEVAVRAGFGEDEAAVVQSLGPADAVVVLSHDPAVDVPALAAALQSRCYVGALGSRHTQARRREQLTADGVGDNALDRIHGPVGLDLGARTPEETAVAIAAEILAHRSGRTAAGLGSTSGPING